MTESNPPTIAVIDDEPPIRRFLRAALVGEGYRVVEAETARAGLRTILEERPDLIVLDLGLPDRDGKEIVAEVRGWSAVPIVILSARDQEREKVAALDAGSRRLPDEAVRRERTAGPRPCRTPARCSCIECRRAGADGAVGRRSHDRLRRPSRHSKWGRGQAHEAGVRPARGPRSQRRQGAHAPLPAQGSLGTGGPTGNSHASRVRRESPTKTRKRSDSAAADHH